MSPFSLSFIMSPIFLVFHHVSSCCCLPSCLQFFLCFIMFPDVFIFHHVFSCLYLSSFPMSTVVFVLHHVSSYLITLRLQLSFSSSCLQLYLSFIMSPLFFMSPIILVHCMPLVALSFHHTSSCPFIPLSLCIILIFHHSPVVHLFYYVSNFSICI
jgi:hypothetical protein